MAVITPNESDCIAYLPSPYTIGLDKDNREELSFNYQINLLHRPTEDDTEDFITFPNLFGQKDGPLKLFFMREPQSLFNGNIKLTLNSTLAIEEWNTPIEHDDINAIEIKITAPKNVAVKDIQSIALCSVDKDNRVTAYIVKNVQGYSDDEKLKSWWIYPV